MICGIEKLEALHSYHRFSFINVNEYQKIRKKKIKNELVAKGGNFRLFGKQQRSNGDWTEIQTLSLGWYQIDGKIVRETPSKRGIDKTSTARFKEKKRRRLGCLWKRTHQGFKQEKIFSKHSTDNENRFALMKKTNRKTTNGLYKNLLHMIQRYHRALLLCATIILRFDIIIRHTCFHKVMTIHKSLIAISDKIKYPGCRKNRSTLAAWVCEPVFWLWI